MKKHPPQISIARARQLRKNATEAERRMQRLLKEDFAEARFRFQVPIRHHIVDFASHQFRIVVEFDGGQHFEEADARRTRELESKGYIVTRFWNTEVLQNGEGCIMRLSLLMAHAHPHPTATRRQVAKYSYPSPIKGEGN